MADGFDPIAAGAIPVDPSPAPAFDPVKAGAIPLPTPARPTPTPPPTAQAPVAAPSPSLSQPAVNQWLRPPAPSAPRVPGNAGVPIPRAPQPSLADPTLTPPPPPSGGPTGIHAAVQMGAQRPAQVLSGIQSGPFADPDVKLALTSLLPFLSPTLYGRNPNPQELYDAAQAHQQQGLASTVPQPDPGDNSAGALGLRGARTILSLIDAVPAGLASYMGGAQDILGAYAGNPNADPRRGADMIKSTSAALVPFSQQIAMYLQGRKMEQDAANFPADRQELMLSQAKALKEGAFGSIADMIQSNPTEFVANMVPIVAPLAEMGMHGAMASTMAGPQAGGDIAASQLPAPRGVVSEAGVPQFTRFDADGTPLPDERTLTRGIPVATRSMNAGAASRLRVPPGGTVSFAGGRGAVTPPETAAGSAPPAAQTPPSVIAAEPPPPEESPGSPAHAPEAVHTPETSALVAATEPAVEAESPITPAHTADPDLGVYATLKPGTLLYERDGGALELVSAGHYSVGTPDPVVRVRMPDGRFLDYAPDSAPGLEPPALKETAPPPSPRQEAPPAPENAPPAREPLLVPQPPSEAIKPVETPPAGEVSPQEASPYEMPPQEEETAARIIPGTSMSEPEYQSWRSLRKTLAMNSPEQNAEMARLAEISRQSEPLDMHEALALNSLMEEKGNATRWGEGQQSAVARFLLDQEHQANARAVDSVADRIHGGENTSELYGQAHQLLYKAPGAMVEDLYDPASVNRIENYLGENFDAYHQALFPELFTGRDRLQDILRDVKEEPPIQAEAVAQAPEVVKSYRQSTQDQYFKLRDDQQYRGYDLNENGNRYLRRNAGLEDRYRQARAEGMPEDLEYDNARMEDAVSGKRHPLAASSPDISEEEMKLAEEERSEAARSEEENSAPIRRKISAPSVAEAAAQRAIHTANLNELTPEEMGHIASLPKNVLDRFDAMRKGIFGEGGITGMLADMQKSLGAHVQASEDRLAENRRQIQNPPGLAGSRPGEAGVAYPVALADIVRHVALKMAQGTLKTLGDANAFLVDRFGPQARRYASSVWRNAKEYYKSGDDSKLLDGHLRDRNGDMIGVNGERVDTRLPFDTRGPDTERPGKGEPPPAISEQKFQQVEAKQGRTPAKPVDYRGIDRARLKAQGRPKAVSVEVPSRAMQDPTVRALRGLLAGHADYYRTAVKPAVSASRAIKADLLESAYRMTDATETQRHELAKTALYGADAPKDASAVLKPLAKVVSANGIDHLREYIAAAGLREFDRFRANTAFDKLTRGEYLYPSEQYLLGKVYGPEITKVLVDNRSKMARLADNARAAQSALVSLMFADRATPLRTTLPATAKLLMGGREGQAALGRAAFDMYKSSLTKGWRENAPVVNQMVKRMPTVASGEAQRMGIRFNFPGEGDRQGTGLPWTRDGNDIALADTDELTSGSHLWDDLAKNPPRQLPPLLKKALQGVASYAVSGEYGHNAWNNSLRSYLYQTRSDHLKSLGFDTQRNPEAFRDVARDVMTTTGRGEFGKYEYSPEAKSLLRSTLLTPRYRKAVLDMTLGALKNSAVEAARLIPGHEAGFERGVRMQQAAAQLPEGAGRDRAMATAQAVKFSSLPRAQRLEAHKAMLSVAALGASSLYALKATGANVHTNLDDPDWGTATKGALRYNPWGGYRIPTRLYLMAARESLAEGRNAAHLADPSLVSGVRPHPFLDPLVNYVTGGLSLPGGVLSEMARAKYGGGAFGQIGQDVGPMFARDALEAWHAGERQGGAVQGAAQGALVGGAQFFPGADIANVRHAGRSRAPEGPGRVTTSVRGVRIPTQ